MSRGLAVPGTALLLALLVLAGTSPAAQGKAGDAPDPAVRLTPTTHPPVPANLSALWYAPATGAALTPTLANFVKGVRLLDEDNNPAAALPLLSQSGLAATAVADYARFYTARALLALQRYPEAEAAFAEVVTRGAEGHLPEDAALGQAEAREAQLDFAGAVGIYDRLVARKLAAPHAVWWRLGVAAQRNNDAPRAIDAYRRVYFEYPLSAEATQAAEALTALNAWTDAAGLAGKELARADVLFTARRWTDARASYDRARAGVTGPDRDRITLRLAACDVQLRRHKAALEPLKGQLSGPFADEATFYYLSAVRGQGDHAEYERQVRAFADRRRESPFAEDALNNLASHYIIGDEDEKADAVFRLLIERYPAGRFAERAYWRSGWWAYRDGRFAEAAALFDRGAIRFPRSDYRPSWLYWSGRAWQQAGDPSRADERFRLTATDYFNSYYGRLARRRLGNRPAAVSQFSRPTVPPPPAFPTASRVTELIAVGLNREALNELQYAQRVWGDSPQITATVALAQNRLGNLRLGINAMKRAYPQWMAAGGEALPPEIQRILFPLDYWSLIRKHAVARGLDPYLMAALVAQESTFDPVIRSSANAVGLMQVLPSTGRQFARTLKLPGYSASRLTDPETNVRLGMAIFAESLRKFGGVHYALAAYNAGDHRVSAWLRERPGLPQDVFIDDIPFPETQNYVRRILGTADDYRRLYGASDAPGPERPPTGGRSSR